MSPAKLPSLRELNIHHVAATGREFFVWLRDQYDFPNRLDTLRLIVPESADVIADERLHQRVREDLEHLLSAFPRVPQPAPEDHRQRTYFLGVAPQWADLASGFDAARDSTSELLSAIDQLHADAAIGLVGLIGPAGSGKSTVVMRAALTLRQQGRAVFFSEGSVRPNVAAVGRALESVNDRAILFVDNAQLFGPVVFDLIAELGRIARPPVIVFAARMNLFERQLRTVEGRANTRILEIGDLSDQEINNLIAKLEEHAQLSRLAGLSSQERFHEFKVRAKKQILVAMREATQGRGFDEIVRSEFEQIDNREARLLFLCAAIGTADLIDIDREQWLACAEVGSADALTILNRNLRGLLIADDRGRVAARHSKIAELIVDILASRSDVSEAYVRLLNTIAHDIYAGEGRNSRTWRLFVRLTDHRRIFIRFSENVELARSIFQSVDRYFQDDGHFWLQFANLEIEYGEPRNARPHLGYAESLMGDHPFVLTTRAHLAMRESRDVESREEALSLRREATDILLEQIRRSGKSDEYPYHVYIAGTLSWLEKWCESVDDARAELEALARVAEDALARHSQSRRLREIAEVVKRKYLMTAVRADDRGRP